MCVVNNWNSLSEEVVVPTLLTSNPVLIDGQTVLFIVVSRCVVEEIVQNDHQKVFKK